MADPSWLVVFGGRRYAFISGTVRNVGAGWHWLNNTAHRPSGPWTCTVTNGYLRIDHPVGAKYVSSFQCTTDETLQALNVEAGISGGLDWSAIRLRRNGVAVDPNLVVSASGNLWITGWLELPEETP